MGCCRVNRCCCCVDLPVGVRIVSLFLVFVEILLIVLIVQLVPQFIFFAVPTSAVGIICHIITFCVVTFGLHRGLSRWLLLPWLIYIMVLVVGLSLAAILLIVIPLGAPSGTQDWPLILGEAAACLTIGGLYLYFWIVVLELFIKMGPFYNFDGVVFSQVPPVPMQGQNYQIYQPYQQQIYQSGQHVLIPVGQHQMYGPIHIQQQQQQQQLQ